MHKYVFIWYFTLIFFLRFFEIILLLPVYFNYYVFLLQNMAQYQLYSSSKESAAVERCPIDCVIPGYCPAEPLPSYNQNNVTPFKIDYSYFINEMSSKRQPSKLREISNYNFVIDFSVQIYDGEVLGIDPFLMVLDFK
jgi:hypothetical protein